MTLTRPGVANEPDQVSAFHYFLNLHKFFLCWIMKHAYFRAVVVTIISASFHSQFEIHSYVSYVNCMTYINYLVNMIQKTTKTRRVQMTLTKAGVANELEQVTALHTALISIEVVNYEACLQYIDKFILSGSHVYMVLLEAGNK